MVQQLDATAPIPVTYCIPTWLRDEQIRQAITRTTGRIEGRSGPAWRGKPIALVCYGPSLNDTWEHVREFSYVMSCSGSHKFLLERGIVPTWHVEVDPRPHKVELMGPPHKDVEYLIASTCHAKVFDHLEGYNVKLWHVFDTAEEGQRLLPPGEWAIFGGANVGLRTFGLARFYGFDDLHVFGMDGCEGASGKHAAAHPNQPPIYAETVYEGVTYRTTPAMLECARQTWHELDQLPGVHATFYGEGLVQTMAKRHVFKPAPPHDRALLGVGALKQRTLSVEYCQLNAQMHQQNLAYGVGGGKHAETVRKLVEQCGVKSVLDYGCGKGYLAKALPFPIWEYDPAIPGKAETPRPAELVVCTDVLEHIEPEYLRPLLFDLKRVVQKIGYFTIHTGAAAKTLPDGRNTHLIQRDRDWWKAKLTAYFKVQSIQVSGPILHVIVSPRAT
jgi:hypothetical protein